MRIDPDLWIKLRPLRAPARLDEGVFLALRDQVPRLEAAGFIVVSGNEADWAICPPQPDGWLDLPYDTVANAKFAVVGVLIRRRCLRPVSRDYQHLPALAERVALLTEVVARWLEKGIVVGGGRDSVEVLFPTVDSFNAWAAEGEFPRRYNPAPFSPYPR